MFNVYSHAPVAQLCFMSDSGANDKRLFERDIRRTVIVRTVSLCIVTRFERGFGFGLLAIVHMLSTHIGRVSECERLRAFDERVIILSHFSLLGV